MDTKDTASSELSNVTSENLQGSLFMVLSMAGFAVNDLIVKSLGETLQLGQTLLLRGCFACLAITALALAMGQFKRFALLASGPVVIRSLAEALATLCFVYSVFNIPIANVTAIFQALPLAITLAAAFFLKEKIGIRRLTAILAGFTGVLIIIRPGMEGFTVFSLFVLAAVVAAVVRDLMTRKVSREIPGLMITLITAVAVTLCGLVVSFFQPWNPVGGLEITLLASTSLFLSVGYYFIIAAMRAGEVGFIAPFRYSMLLFAIAGGYFFFDETPDMLTLVGAAIIVASGIYTLYRERMVHNQAITPPPQR